MDMVFYYLTIYLAFLATGFPVGMLSIIWPLISEKLTVAIPYISLVRAMIAAGGVIACILSGRKVWKQDRALDLCLTGVSLETLGVIGLSLSRLFWHLLLWAFVLGFGIGVAATFLCIEAVREKSRLVFLQFSGLWTGTFLGTWILTETIDVLGSWRTGCQILGLTQIAIAAVAFLTRRVIKRDEKFRIRLDERFRKAEIDREREKNSRKTDVKTLVRIEKQYMKRVFLCCGAAFLLGIFIMADVLWPQSYRVAYTGASQEMTGFGMLAAAGGLAAGCLLYALILPMGRIAEVILYTALPVTLLLQQYLLHENSLTDYMILGFQFLTCAAVGPLFPKMVLIDDIRLDRDAETSLISLLPSFGIGSVIVVTPLTQSLVRAGQTEYFILYLLLVGAGILICLFLSNRAGKD